MLAWASHVFPVLETVFITKFKEHVCPLADVLSSGKLVKACLGMSILGSREHKAISEG